MIFFRSLLFMIGNMMSHLMFLVLIPVALPFSYQKRFYIIRVWTLFNLWWLRVTCGLGFQVLGKENIPNETAIIMSKHQSTWETFGLQMVFPPHTWVLKRSLLYIPLFGWALWALNCIAIDRKAGKKALMQVVKDGTVHLDNGMWVVVFPEGTRTSPGERKPYQIGGAMLASRSGYPIVPVAHNAGMFWTRNSFFRRPGTITLSIGPTIPSKGRKPAEINAEVEAWIEAEMERITTLP